MLCRARRRGPNVVVVAKDVARVALALELVPSRCYATRVEANSKRSRRARDRQLASASARVSPTP